MAAPVIALSSEARSITRTSPPAPSAHRVQFYEDEGFLAQVVSDFAAAGLSAGEAVVVIATEEHRKRYAAGLARAGHDLDAVVSSGQLVMLDARATLERLMAGRMPDWSLFKEALTPILKLATDRAPARRVRAYGEMVDLLWNDSNPAAAIRLEELWNDLAQLHRFSLLCTYSMRSFRLHEDSAGFEKVCDAHSHVAPSEQYARLEEADERLREISRLQHRAQLLEAEVARRAEVEKRLLAALTLRDEFLAVAGHELRTPLTALRLQIQLVLTAFRKDRPIDVLERLNKIRGQGDRMVSLVDGLLDVARITMGRLELQPEPFDLAELVREVAERSSPAAALAGCDLQVQAEEPVEGRWDRMRLEQLVSNLLGNALKYGRGCPVEVTVRRTERGAELIFRDQGIGIAPEHQARIFERFERAAATSTFAGLGVGLWLARQITDAHAGTIRVESELQRGATFYVELPLSPPSAGEALAPVQIAGHEPAGR